jgi:hypothetical protein
MADATETPLPEPRVYVQFEREAGDRYSILSRDLETIGSQLRGKSRFSVFNSIILPVLVTLVTLAATSLFQFVSWQNSIKLQAASDEASAASRTYDRAAAEIDKRYYATFLFQVAVKNVANRKTAPETQLSQYDLELQKRRFEEFYKELAIWNQDYSQLLNDISYDIDRPIFKDRWTENGYQIRKEILNRIKCDVVSIANEIEANNLDKFALANHFAVVNKCFSAALNHFGALKDAALSNKDRIISAEEFEKADDELDGVRSMLNEFRCYALTRVHFLTSLKENTILFSNWFGQNAQSIKAHLADTANRCKIS